MMDGRHGSLDALVADMSFTEKVGQLNQRLLGWNAVERRRGHWEASDELKREIDRWGGLGLLYGLFRADAWSGRSWRDGIRPEERSEVMAVVQDAVATRGRHGIGVLSSEEAPHGHQALGGTVLPANLALGASFDPAAVREAERAVARELSASGVHIALVSGLDVVRDPRWGRSEECFGEDPHLVARMCEAAVEGMQGRGRCDIGHGGVAVVLKHLAGQGGTVGGRNGQSTVIGEHDLREIHLPAAEAGIQAGVWGLMAAYNDIDGVPCCANAWLLQRYLREELGFDGVVMADGLAVDFLADLTGSIGGAGRTALLSGVDVSLWDRGFAELTRFEDDPQVVARVDEAVMRVLRLKAAFGLVPGLCDRPDPPPELPDLDEAMRDTRCQARRLSAKVMVPITGDASAVFRSADGPTVVAGPLANDHHCFLGDYVAPCDPDEPCGGVYDALLAADPDRETLLGPLDADDVESCDALDRAGVVVCVLGGTSERHYGDTFADNGAASGASVIRATCGEGVDYADVSLPWHQDGFLHRLAERTKAPIITVVVSGRATVLCDVMACSDAVLWAGYSGAYGPQGVADCLMGSARPSGRMPVTLPADAHAVPVCHDERHSPLRTYADVPDPVLVPFGFRADDTAKADACTIESRQGTLHVATRLHDAASGTYPLYAYVRDGLHTPRSSRLAALSVPSEDAGQVGWTVHARTLCCEPGELTVRFTACGGTLGEIRVTVETGTDGRLYVASCATAVDHAREGISATQ